MENNKIVVVGSINMDLVVKVPYVPLIGETIMGKSVERVAGGKGANQAVTAAKLGANAAMLGKVGGDEFGPLLIDHMMRAGVDTSSIVFEAEASSGLALIQVNDEGDNCIVVLSGANGLCDPAFIKAHDKQINEAEIMIVQMEIPDQAVYQAIELAKSCGTAVILNPAPAPNPGSIPRDVWGQIDYVIPNETELQKLTGMPVHSLDSAETASRKLLALGASNVIVTLGSNGSLFVNSNTVFHTAAPVVEVVDTTAAGDSFVAAFAVGLTERMSEMEAIAFATKVSSTVVTRAGAQTSIPDRKEVEAIA